MCSPTGSWTWPCASMIKVPPGGPADAGMRPRGPLLPLHTVGRSSPTAGPLRARRPLTRRDAPLLIGELARRTGVSERLLRYYEEQGVLPVAPPAERLPRL
ncbi:MerR family DNA-binding transcriptional regulator [Actinomadura rupiterrae]|uniref:MerR family DNA-binding transcriptional regulator n=1 Tax=Actinomadura rupiterrae TaxID=559627 RepID=UPI0035590608